MSLRLPIYLDNHSTTQVDPRVVDAMLPYFSQYYGNAASKHHQFGWNAEAAVEKARKQLAELIGSDPDEIVFTSGATESINLALKGIAEGYRARGNHIITVATEHRAVLDTCRRLKLYGFNVTLLPVDRFGMVSQDELHRAITPATILVSVMFANNEVGTIAPVAGLGAICRERGIVFHTDATQAVGKIPVNVHDLNVDLLSFSAHKMYGPKGVGALYIRKSKPPLGLVAQTDGGGHEKAVRSGTLNVPAIVGFGEAAAICSRGMREESHRIASMRDRLVDGIASELEDVWINGHPEMRLPNNANICFPGMNADSLIMEMKEIAVSTGSACSSAIPEPSHVLKAIGLNDEDTRASIRFGIGRFNTEEEIDHTIAKVVETVRVARKTSPTYHLAHT